MAAFKRKGGGRGGTDPFILLPFLSMQERKSMTTMQRRDEVCATASGETNTSFTWVRVKFDAILLKSWSSYSS